MLHLLIALAVALAPVGAAMAAPGLGSTEVSVAAAMADCAGHAMHQDANAPSDDGGCCDTLKAACQSSTCMAKCYKLLGKLGAPAASTFIITAVEYVIRQQEPPTWHSDPLPRPPRT